MPAKKKPARQPKTKAKDTFLWQCQSKGLIVPEVEFFFHNGRSWRFDYAWPCLMVALECEGGAWQRGRHTRGKGFREDLEKYLAATVAGWTVLRVDVEMIKDGTAIDAAEKVLKNLMDG